MKKRILSIVLAVAMIMSMAPMALAAEDDISYVSLGDSMANGYGLDGYYCGDHNVNGYLQIAKAAYPNLFAEWLRDNTTGVEHTQLAISAMRAEDLHFILEYGEADAYEGDDYTEDEFIDGRFDDFKGIDNTKAGTVNVAAKFQTSVADADIISMGIGNANFGVFLLGRVMNVLDPFGNASTEGDEWIEFEEALQECDPEAQEVILDIYDTVYAKLASRIGEDNPAMELVEPIAYAVASYVLNVNGAMDRIIELNPDVELIIVGIMNTMEGLPVVIDLEDGSTVEVDMGWIMAPVIESVNAYLAALPAAKQALGYYEEASIYYAEAKGIDMLVSQMAGIDSWDGYEIVRDRFIEEVTEDTVFPMLSGALGMELPAVDRKTVEMFESNSGTEEGKAAFAKYVWTEVLGKSVSADEGIVAAMTQAGVLYGAACTIYLGFEQAIIEALEDQTLDAGSFMALATEGGLNAILGEVMAKLPSDLTELTSDNLAEALNGNEAMNGLLVLFSRMMVGNGIGCHPSEDGHETLADAVIGAYEGKYTAADAVVDKAEALFKAAAQLVAENYEEIYAGLYDYAEEQGYIAAAGAALDAVAAYLDTISVEALQLSDELKAELAQEIALAKETIAQLKALIAQADTLDDAAYAAAMELLDKAGETLANIQDILAVAGADIETEINDALNALNEELRDKAAAVIDEAKQALEDLESYLTDEVAPAVRAEIQDLIDEIESQLDYIEAVVNGEIDAAVEDVTAALAGLEQAVNELLAAAGEEADALLKAAVAEAQAVIDSAVAQFQAAIHDATHASIGVCQEHYYVSLGGADAAGAGVGRNDAIYSELLAQALEDQGVAITVSDASNEELTYAGLAEYIAENAGEIAKATLITYNMSAGGFINDALFSEEAPDWSAYIADAEVMATVEQVKAEVLAKLAGELDAETLSIAAPFAEKLVYSAVSYVIGTVEALEAINAINPQATVLVIGMNNPLDGMTLTVGGEVIDLGEIFGYVVEATDLYHLVYAVVSGNVVFVEADEAAVNGVGSIVVPADAQLSALAGSLMAKLADIKAGMLVSAEGHSCIAEQIMAALTVADHDYAQTVTAPTCTEDGRTTYTCALCGDTYTVIDEGSALGHDFTGEYQKDADGHWHICARENCQVTDEKADHVYDNSQDASCNICGYERTVSSGGTGGSGTGGGSASKPAKDEECDGGKDCPSGKYSDLDADLWYHEATDYVISEGLMNGIGGGLFDPQGSTSRAMIVATLYRMEGEPAQKAESAYSDVAEGMWYTDAIIWATEKGIVNGYGDGTFGPDDVVTREQIAAVFYRYAQYKGLSTKASADLSGYSDAGEVSDWALKAMKWANGSELMIGRTGTTLVPAGSTTRCEMATLLMRWCQDFAK